MAYKWKPSQTAKREFAQKMSEIDIFCRENGITHSKTSDSYYFSHKGINYRVSNHTIEKSNATMRELGKAIYHENGREDNTVYITASKTRIVEIFNDIINGYALDKRGNRI